MGSLASMLSAVLITDFGSAVTRIKRNSILWLLIGILFLTTYVFALVAGTLYLSRMMTVLEATLIMAGASLVIGVVIIGVMYALEARDRRIAAERRRKSQMQTNIAVVTALTLLRKKPLLSAGLAVAAGTALSFLKRPGRD